MSSRARYRWLFFVAVAALSATLVPTPAVSEQAASVWMDIDGNPLPFATDEELMEFLRTADIESVTSIPIGVTGPRRVTLTKGGITARAALRDFEEVYEQVRLEGTFYARLRDSYAWDLPAYRMSQILGLDNIPPVVHRRVNGQPATLQIWLEGGLMESDRIADDISPPATMPFRRQQEDMRVFDTLIGNTDRNSGNILYDENWKFWLIDHSRAFLENDQTRYLDRITWCERGLFETIQKLERDTLREQLDGLLTIAEINAMLRRRDKLVAHFMKLIEERGESAVLFERGSR